MNGKLDAHFSPIDSVRNMNTFKAATILVVAAVLWVSLEGSDFPQGPPASLRGGGTQMASKAASSTVFASHIARDGRLVLLVLWRGSPAWLMGAQGDSGGGGGSSGRTSLYFTAGGLTFDVQVDDAAAVATVLGRQISLKETNVVLVDDVDSKPTIVRMERVDPAVLDAADVGWAVLKRQPELVEFLQCDLMRSSPLLQRLPPDYLKAWAAVHPCGAAITQ